METKSPALTGTPHQQTATSSPAPSGGQKTRESRRAGRAKKHAAPDDKVPLTISVTPTFLRRIRIAAQGLDESLSTYVESRLASVVARDLKKVLEEMA